MNAIAHVVVVEVSEQPNNLMPEMSLAADELAMIAGGVAVINSI
jgi:hypothetical protein